MAYIGVAFIVVARTVMVYMRTKGVPVSGPLDLHAALLPACAPSSLQAPIRMPRDAWMHAHMCACMQARVHVYVRGLLAPEEAPRSRRTPGRSTSREAHRARLRQRSRSGTSHGSCRSRCSAGHHYTACGTHSTAQESSRGFQEARTRTRCRFTERVPIAAP